jgi:hypothetical protein
MSESGLLGQHPESAGVWRKPSRCDLGECVEVRQQGALVMMRESARPEAIIYIEASSWRAFSAAIRAGEFDNLD